MIRWELGLQVQTPDAESFGIMRITGSNGVYAAAMETDQFGLLNVNNFNLVGQSFLAQ